MKRLSLAALFLLVLVGSAFAMREAPEPASDRWVLAQGRVARALAAPQRWWKRVSGRSALRYDFSRARPASEPAGYPSDRPRQIEIFLRSEARTQLSPDLRLLAGFPEGGGMTAEELAALFRRVDGADRKAYLRDILDKLQIDLLPDAAAKVARIVEFAQDAVAHDPIVAPPTYDPVAILELGKGRCGQVNYNVLPALLNAAGFKTRRVRLPAHAALEVWYSDGWHYVDADMLKGGDLLLKPDGMVPDTAWLTTGTNALLIDTYETWPDAYAYSGAPVNAAGKRVTGFIGTGNAEDAGYPSARFGAALAYPPSPPELEAREIVTAVPTVRLRWGGSYDRDNDLAGYEIELGNAPGRADLQRIQTTDPEATIELPSPGKTFYRVRAFDRRRESEPRTFYRPSEEGVIRYEPSEGQASAIITDGWPTLPAAATPPEPLATFSPGEVDATGEARFFIVDWFNGRALKLVDLSDNLFPGGSIDGPQNQRAELARPLPTGDGDKSITVGFDLYLERRGYGGTDTFLIAALDAGEQRIALTIDPERDELAWVRMPAGRASAALKSGYWTSYPGEWADPNALPEVVVVRREEGEPQAPASPAQPLDRRNAFRIEWHFSPIPAQSGPPHWHVTANLNGKPWGEADVDSRPTTLRFLSNPADEAVYVVDNVRTLP